ncbi:hypothetical protein SAY87_026476 [Trapa incisa]|uniref:Mediator of RNA polymerase II transcription subunit 25 n=1 Tax=Trapa incisa TaxID=236973 RepID=A0AAN7GXX3_9MYRT|nr:hypothetical protein SAY87_026476 [Trapa incisa]
MTEKQLIVAVEGTAAMGPYWQTVVSDYLEKIVRSFAGNDSSGQKQPSVNVELSLVMFTSHGSYSASLVQRSGWTRDVDIFLQWLLAIPFVGGGFNDAAIAEGLAEALMMFRIVPNGTQTQQTMDGKRHCILIAASNPYPLPTPIYRLKFQSSETENIEAQAESCLSDAEAVAKSFPQGLVSLSVICPKQLAKVKAIYSSAKRFPQAPDPPVDNTRNPQFLVMISENFMEARAALSHPGISTLHSNQTTLKMDMHPVNPVTVQPQQSIRAANGSMMNWPPVSVGNGPAIVKVEPTTITSVSAPPSGFSHMPRPVSQGVLPALQTSSPPSVVSQDVTANSDCTQDLKPVVSGTISQPLRPGGPANSNILNNLSQVRQVVNSAALSVGTSIGLPTISQNPMAMHMSNMISSSGTQSSAPPNSASQNVFSSQCIPASISGSFPTATSSISGNSSGISQQPTGNLQGIGQGVQSMGQGNLIGGSQMVSSGMGMNQNIMASSGTAAGTGAGAGTGTMIPTPGMAPSGMQSLGGGNNANPGANIPLVQQSSSLQTAQSKYVKVWEGNLSGQRQGQPVFITRLEGYRNSSASETLAANWPPTMQIVRLISQDHMNNKQYVGKADFLVFRAMNQHGFLIQLQEKKLCAVIQLPSQTLLLSVSDKAYRLIGMLFPGDMVVFKPQNNQQQQLQQQQLPQLQQQQFPQLQQQQIPQLQQQQQQQQIPQLQQQQMTQLQQQQQQQQIPQLQQQQMSQLQQQQQQQQQLSQLQQQQQQQLHQQQQLSQMQQQQLSQIQQQQQQQHPQQQLQQLQQQRPQQQQQLVGTGMGQGYAQGPNRSQLVSQGQMSSQVPPTIPGGGFMS